MGTLFNPDLTNWQLGKLSRQLKQMNRQQPTAKPSKFFKPKVKAEQKAPISIESAMIAERKLFVRYAIGVDEHKTNKAGKAMLLDMEREFRNDCFKRDFNTQQEVITEDFCNEVKSKVFGITTQGGFSQKYKGGKNGEK